MRSEWRTSTWGEEITLEYGKALRGYEIADGKYRVFGSNGPVGWTSQPLTAGPGVILGRKGAYRGVQYSPEPFFVIDTAYYVVPKTELDMRWLYYAIKHYKLGEIDDGSPIPSTTRAAAYVQDLEVPPHEEQRAIAHILGTLDDKIELNRKMNQTLEAMARAIFKSWFVDFLPVRAKMQARTQTCDPVRLPAPRPGKFYVYAIECEDDSVYIGFTEDLPRRWDEHLSGKGADWTKSHRPLRVAYFEEQDSKKAAIAREKELKTGFGRKWLKRQISDNKARQAGTKAEGRDPGLPAGLAVLFPDSFEDSELGEIPKGWRVIELEEIAEVIDCLHSKKPERRSEGLPLLQLWNIRDDGLIDMTDTYFIDENDYKKWISRMHALPGDCVITNVGRVGAVAQIPEGLNAALGRNMTGIRCKKAFQYPTFLIECMLSDAMKSEIVLKKDTGTILDALNVRNIPKLRAVLPASDLLAAFEKAARPIRAKMERNLVDSNTLAALRDVLLPKLLSGEIRVKG